MNDALKTRYTDPHDAEGAPCKGPEHKIIFTRRGIEANTITCCCEQGAYRLLALLKTESQLREQYVGAPPPPRPKPQLGRLLAATTSLLGLSPYHRGRRTTSMPRPFDANIPKIDKLAAAEAKRARKAAKKEGRT